MPVRRCNSIDRHIGERVRRRRKDWGIKQQALATSLGISQQQLQKYETGRNRISASKLFEISRQLQMPVAWFFEGLKR